MSAAKSVLVVEDDSDIRESLLGLLADEGYEVRACSNGLEALEHLRVVRNPDVILLDLMMPVMDGWQFRVQQKRDPRIAAIPVVVISADGTAKAAAIDADAYLRKPVEYGTLVSSIERTLLAVERRNLQASLVETERLASLGTLAAGVAHEINNPLSYVMANLEYVADAVGKQLPPGDSRALREALAETREGCERIRSIVRDLQLFSREPEKGGGPVDVRRILDSSANIVMNEIRVRAKLTKDYEEVPLLDANATRLGQVFLNLVLNAAQSIPEGNPAANEIRLVVRAVDGAILVQVSDTGGGIPREIRGQIFDPFFTTKPLGVGTGLGLSISHGIIAAMNGTITVESEPGQGSTFRVRLPIQRKSASTSAAPKQGKAAAASRARILVIDDEAMICAMLERSLADAHDVEAMTDPEAALGRLAAGERFDLILCDMMMPGRSGIEVQEAIEKLSPAQAERMIFLTGGTISPRARAFVETPGRLVVPKPFSIQELLHRIAEALEKHPAGPARE